MRVDYAPFESIVSPYLSRRGYHGWSPILRKPGGSRGRYRVAGHCKPRRGRHTTVKLGVLNASPWLGISITIDGRGLRWTIIVFRVGSIELVRYEQRRCTRYRKYLNSNKCLMCNASKLCLPRLRALCPCIAQLTRQTVGTR